MSAMNSITPLYRRLLVVVLCLLVICLAAHFLHDLQPGHFDFQGAGPASRVCHMAIHSGVLGGIVPSLALAIFVYWIVSFPQVFNRSGSHTVLLPPPILA